MNGRRGLVGVILALALGGAGCGSAAAPTATPLPAASSGPEFAATWCASMQAMFRAIGNPDTAADSELSAALDDAITLADYSAAERLAAMIQAELTIGRGYAEAAAGWAQGATMAGHVDRVLAAFGAMIEAKRAAARDGLPAADGRGQAAFEAAGGIDAWYGMIESARTLPPEVMTLISACRFEGDAAPS
jgi:hypothetical protein